MFLRILGNYLHLNSRNFFEDNYGQSVTLPIPHVSTAFSPFLSVVPSGKVQVDTRKLSLSQSKQMLDGDQVPSPVHVTSASLICPSNPRYN